jgi:adenosylhomocysteinase
MDFKPNCYKIKDISLAKNGLNRIEWAQAHMPVVNKLRKKYAKSRPLENYKIAGAIHVTKETAVLLRALKELGAEISWAACNPLSTQDDVAAQLVLEGIKLFAWCGNHKEYYWCIDQIIKIKPDISMDDGADVVFKLHQDYPDLADNVIGGTEETTTGVHRLENMASVGELRYPIIAVNNAETKWDFDNVYGTGQGVIDGILRATSVLLAGKVFLVAGYGHCGRGVSKRARGMGANVIVTEVDPIKALKAVMDGYRVMPMNEGIKLADIVVTTTGNKDIVTKEHFPLLKNGAILANAGHFDVEVRVDQLEEYAISKTTVRKGTVKYELPNKRHVYLLSEGRLVNLASAEGHPSSVMDLSFANQILSILWLVKEGKNFEKKVYEIPRSQDQLVAKLKLASMGISIDTLTDEQRRYMKSFGEGT